MKYPENELKIKKIIQVSGPGLGHEKWENMPNVIGSVCCCSCVCVI